VKSLLCDFLLSFTTVFLVCMPFFSIFNVLLLSEGEYNDHSYKKRLVQLGFCCTTLGSVNYKIKGNLNLWHTYISYSYNKSQQDALFLNVILVKNSTCFGQVYCPSSGVLILYSQQPVFVILVTLPDSLADSQHNQYDKYLLLCIQY